MKRCCLLLLVVAVAAGPTQGRSRGPSVRTLVLQPAKFDPAVPVSLILPMDDSRTDGDGAAFYDKAVQLMPTGLDQKKI